MMYYELEKTRVVCLSMGLMQMKMTYIDSNRSGAVDEASAPLDPVHLTIKAWDPSETCHCLTKQNKQKTSPKIYITQTVVGTYIL